MKDILTVRLTEARENRLRLLMYREDLVRHIQKLQADVQITDRDIVAFDARAAELTDLLALIGN